MALLKNGSKGADVTALQQQLVAMGFSLSVDGDFGPGTEAAVKDLQECFGYTVDGLVGDGTQGLIGRQTANGWSVTAPDGIKAALQAQGKTTDKGSLAGPDLRRTLKKGLDGSDVTYLQRRLSALGYGLGIDGQFGGGTEQSVRALQEAFGYTVDGIVGNGTNTLINAQIGHDWKASVA